MRQKSCHFRCYLALAGILIFFMGFDSQASQQRVPKEDGFSQERLHRLTATLHNEVDAKQVAGVVYLLAHHEKMVALDIYGEQDIQKNIPLKRDTIFRIFSMSKPVTAVAMMILYEEGKWLPSDPIDKYIPEFKQLKVYAGKNSDGSLRLENPVHAPTMGELMTHTAGFGLGFIESPVNELYKKSNLFESTDFHTFINRVASLPLDYQPGTAWEYSISSDIQGYLVEKLSGVAFEKFLAERIFAPLDMQDTGFHVDANKSARLATTYQPDSNNVLQPMWQDDNSAVSLKMLSGGGGLFSTVDDYWHFSQMLLNKGIYHGKRILSPSTVTLMTTNHLPDKLRDGRFGIGTYTMQPGLGFGYGMGVYDDPVALNKPLGAGTFFWIGAAGTWFWIDPENNLVFIGLSQRWMLAPGMPKLEETSQALVYQALQ